MFCVSQARICLLSFLLVLAGCAGQKTHELLATAAISTSASEVAGTHDIYVATTRARAEDKRQVFDGQRSSVLSFARVTMAVPKIHKVGEIERRKKNQKADPAKYFTATNVVAYDSQPTFSSALNADIARRGGRALVFVHGYNTQFDDAIYRMTQIAHDAGYAGTPVLFSWASGGKTVDYVYDSNSASAARDQLEVTLRMLAQSGATRIDIIAHSMGNWVTMEALRQLAITGDRDLNGKLGDVVLASPDIDVDVFKSQMRRYGRPSKPFYLLLSGDDRALELSQIIAGNKPRLGGYKDAADIATYGVVVVDLTNVSAGDRLNHTKFADNPILVKLLGEGLRDDDRFTAQSEDDVTRRIGQLTQGIGQTVGSAADIIITTPFEVLKIAVGR